MDFTRKNIIMIGGIALGVIALLLIVGFIFRQPATPPVHLVVWGAYDDLSAFSSLISSYTSQNKNISIKYEQKNPATYEEELIRAYAEDKAPDIWMMQNTWLPKYKTIIAEMPQTLDKTLPFTTFQNTFVDVVQKDFSDSEKIYALPLYVDTLAMYYNKDFFNTAGISSPPTTWDELMADMNVLVKKDQWGNIQRAGVALGTAGNVNRATDILELLMLQNGTKMVNDNKTMATFDEAMRKNEENYYPGRDALRFYTDFANPSKRVYTWNKEMPNSIDAFVNGDTAIMFNYSHQIPVIKARAPYLNFGIAPMPQVKNRTFDVNFANYWGFTVSKKSRAQEEAWKFIIYLSQSSSSKKYLEKTAKPTARRDLIEWQKSDLQLGIFANQSLTAQSWYQIDNAKIETIFSNAIDSVILGSAAINKAMETAANQVNLLMKSQ